MSSFHDYWQLGDDVGNADSDDILKWFNQQLKRAGMPTWERYSRVWNYVQWKLDIPKGNEKIWIFK